MTSWSAWLVESGSRLGWTLMHAVWQTALVALIYVAWRMSRRATLPTRYRVASGALLLSVLFSATTWWDLGRTHAVPAVPAITRPTGSLVERAPSVGPVETRTRPAFESGADLTAALPWLAAVWLVGALALGARLVGGWLVVRGIRRRAVPVRSAHLLDMQQRLARRLGLRAPGQLLESRELQTPVAIGWQRPAVLLPTWVLRTSEPQAIEPLIAHELAHVRGGDYAANLIQTGLDAALFLCPGARWLSNEVRSLREYRCDDLAAEACGSPETYARALTGLIGWSGARGLSAPGAAGPRLADRLRRLLEGEPMSRPRPSHTLVLAFAIVVTMLSGLKLLAVSARHAPTVAPVVRDAEGTVLPATPAADLPRVRNVAPAGSPRGASSSPAAAFEHATMVPIPREAANAAQTPIRLAYDPRAHGSPIELQLDLQAPIGSQHHVFESVRLQNQSSSTVTSVAFVAVLEDSRAPRVPVRVFTSEPMPVNLVPGAGAELPLALVPMREALRLEEEFGVPAQAMLAVLATRSADGTGWSAPLPNPSVVDSRQALGKADPRIPRSLLAPSKIGLAGSPHDLCYDAEHLAYSEGALVLIAEDVAFIMPVDPPWKLPGLGVGGAHPQFARCTSGAWVEVQQGC